MSTPVVVQTRAELAELRSVAGQPVSSAGTTQPGMPVGTQAGGWPGGALLGVVMTLGALHEGHRVLIREARRLVGNDGQVMVTVFVNPLQFGEGEDFERYPRGFDDDLAVCAEEGVDVVFAPSRAEMYPDGTPRVSVDPGPLGQKLEGVARPTHFAGVLTVVAKLLNITVPDYAMFGEKDYQQLALVRRMVTDFDLPFRIVGVPTVREPDGLALSSRNRYLSGDERETAVALSKALTSGADAAPAGPEAVLRAARAVLDRHPELELEYLELRTTDLAAAAVRGEARLLVAARIGSTRLLDNLAVRLPRVTHP